MSGPKKCKECNGAGELFHNYTDKKGTYYSEGYTCPVCMGIGTPISNKDKEAYDDACIFDGTKTYEDDESYLNIEENE